MKSKDIDLEMILDRTDLLFYLADLDGKILYISNAGTKLIGKDKASIIGRNIFDFFPLEVSERRLSILSNIFKTLEPLSFFDERDGHFFKTMAYPILDDSGKLKQIAAYVQDLTEIKKAEKKTEEIKTEMESTIKGSPAHVFRFRKDNQGNIVAVLSEGIIAEKFGITTKVIKGRNLLELFGRENFNRILPFYEKAFCGGQVSFEICLRDTWFQTTIAPFEKDENGIVLEVIGYSMDISIIRKAQEELEKAEKLESLGVLAGGIAHDFNNLLGGLFGYIDLARVSMTCDNPAKEYIDAAMQCFARARDLTQQLLTFSKGGAPERKPIPLEPLIQESIRLALSGSSIRCEKNLQRELHLIHADHGQINQVFNNVLLNARQAMPNGGIINIEASNKDVKEDEFPCIRKGAYVHIRFVDHGTGIPKENLTRVFDPFYTTKQAGSGLGLATSYSIIRKHEGHIYLESELGKGTTVNILLPATTDFPRSEDKPDDSICAGKCRILLMDDEEVMRNVASEMIGRAGCEITCVENGEKAIEKYSASMSAEKKFDVVILDLTVIAGMGGENAVRRLLEIDPNVKAIVSSGYSDSPILAKPTEYGFSGKIAKPYQLNELLKVIAEVMNKRQAPARK